MESLKKRRSGFRSRTTVIGQSLTTELANATPNLETIESYHLELLRLRDTILELDSQILDLSTENPEPEISDSSDKIMKVNLFISKAEKALQPPPNPLRSYHQEQNSNPTFAKLPQLYLLKFDGDPLSWNSFWELFKSSVHDRKDLPAPSKFQYLIGQLQGEALKLVNGFSHTSEEYKEAIELLVKTYGDKKILIQSRLNALFDLSSPDPTAESLSEFRSDYEGHIRVLKTLGTDVEASGFVFAHLLMRKLPITTRDNLNRANKADTWTLETFRESIKAEIDNLAALNENKCKSDPNVKSRFTPTASFPTVSKGTKIRLCPLCQGQHLIFNCDTYETPKSRSDRVKALKLCYNCLMSNHTVSMCLNNNNCRVCHKRHHTSLCNKNSKPENSKNFKNQNKPKMSKNSHESDVEPTGALVSTSSVPNHSLNRTAILPTADVTLSNDKISVKGKALLDTGSQRSFVLKSVVQNLKLKSHKTINLKIDGFQSKGTTETYNVVNLPIQTDEGIVTIDACVINSMVDRIYMPGRENLISKIKSNACKLADQSSNDRFNRIDVLIGVDHYFKFVHGNNLVDDIYQISSKLGTLIMGTVFNGNPDNESVSTVLRVGVSDISEDQNLSKLWELETIGISKPETDDRLALEKFQSSLEFDGNKYYADLPWKNDTVKLPTNISMAYSRMKSMWATLGKDETKLNHYDNVIKTQLERGFIEEVTDCTATSKRTHYLPHHFVEKNSETTPLRVVFDCSAKSGKNSYSLNDCLLTGPSLVHHMASILLRFRLDDFMCSSDIEKAFLMVGLNPDDRDSCRFFWPENVHDENSKIKTYRFCVVLFGSTASQFLLNSTLIHHLSKYNSAESLKLGRNIYIDNVLASFNSEISMQKFFSSAIKIMSDGGFTLREWISNSTKFNENLPEAYRNKSETHKILGVNWNVKDDTIKVSPFVPPSDFVPTKREVVKFIAKTFDVYGFLLPITITGKILIQDIWSHSIGWDEKIPQTLEKTWQSYIENLGKISISCQRKIGNFSCPILHVFADASKKAFGAAAYFAENG